LLSLSENQIEKLAVHVDTWLNDLHPPLATTAETEPKFTASALLPWLQSRVEILNKGGLYVRGDGGPVIKPVIWEGVPFLPDLSVVMGDDKYVAFEVKLLRDQDPGGSLSKAIGQTLLYSKLGYSYSFGLIFDCRSNANKDESFSIKDRFEITPRAKICIFR
jgi:hypothetical protein